MVKIRDAVQKMVIEAISERTHDRIVKECQVPSNLPAELISEKVGFDKINEIAWEECQKVVEEIKVSASIMSSNFKKKLNAQDGKKSNVLSRMRGSK